MKKIVLLIILGVTVGLNAQITELPNGNVGVGISTGLTQKLTVNGGVDLIGNSINSTGDVGLLLYRPGELGASSTRWFLRADLTNNESYPYLTNRTPNGKVVIKTGSSSGGSENTHFTINGGDGVVNASFEDVNLGVGISTGLTQKLTVNGGVDLIGNSINSTGDVGLLLYRPGELGASSTRWFLRADLTNNESYPYLTNRTPNGKVVIKTGSSSGGSENTHFTINGGDGVVNASFMDVNLGIGTTDTKGFKLGVNGKIHAKEVKIDLIGWSDFVFFDDYNLPTLLEVESHIKQKGHLKDIPSAKEVEENGIYLGEMNAKLLQKIEELMLYTIAQQKEIEKQSEKITIVENKNKELTLLSKKFTELQIRLEKLELKN